MPSDHYRALAVLLMRLLMPLLVATYAFFSVVAFVSFGVDKLRARRGQGRIAERTLHLFELLGGWPGALLGMRLFHHKSRKASYQRVFWAIVALHVLLLGVALSLYRR